MAGKAEPQIRDQGVGGSNPLSPTNLFNKLQANESLRVTQKVTHMGDPWQFPGSSLPMQPDKQRLQAPTFQSRMLLSSILNFLGAAKIASEPRHLASPSGYLVTSDLGRV